MPERVDPFESLRSFTVARAPRPEFAASLRRRLEVALGVRPDPDPDPAPNPEVPTMSSPLSPYLMIRGAAAAMDWYADVFRAIELVRFVGDDGRIGHAELDISGAHVLLADEYPEIELVGPEALGGTPVALYLRVADVDHTHERAVSAGATSLREPADQGHGNRIATIVDPFGHRWMLSQPIDAERAATAERERGIGGDGSAWEITGRVPVEPGYLVMRADDIERARAFYGALFGWRIATGNVEGGGHVGNTRFPMGFAPPAPDAPDVVVHFRVEDVAAYTARVVELGGRVLATAEHPSGFGAECVDDQGRRFDLWQPAPGY